MHNHNNLHEYDDNCPGCQPAIIDITTGIPFKPDDPVMIAVLKAFKEKTTLAERRAWHRITMNQSKNTKDMEIAQQVTEILVEAFDEQME